MTTSNRNHNDPPRPQEALQSLCTDHLCHEATLLTSALQTVQAMETAFQRRSGRDFAATVSRHAEVLARIEELERQRRQFGAAASRLLPLAPEAATLPAVLGHLPEPDRAPLAAELERVRATAEELAGLVRRVSAFLRIHLDAYQRILRDLTNSGKGCGRYGPTGAAEVHDYRPLLQIHG